MSQNINFFYTHDIDLAAVLGTMHFKLRKSQPIVRVYHKGLQRDTFYFIPKTTHPECGEISARQIAKAWYGKDHNLTGKQFEIYDTATAALKNRVWIMDCIKTHVKPIVHSQIDGREVYLPLDASPELRRKMQRMIEETA